MRVPKITGCELRYFRVPLGSAFRTNPRAPGMIGYKLMYLYMVTSDVRPDQRVSLHNIKGLLMLLAF